MDVYLKMVIVMNKRNFTLFTLLCCIGPAHAGVLDPDCDAEKATKATATKAVVGVGGRCTPKEALKDTTVEATQEALPDEGLAGKAVDAAMPEKEKKPIKNTTQKIITD